MRKYNVHVISLDGFTVDIRFDSEEKARNFIEGCILFKSDPPNFLIDGICAKKVELEEVSENLDFEFKTIETWYY